MSSVNSNQKEIKLKKSSVLNVPFQKYEKDFTFIVNGKKYETSRFVADLLSKNISDLHLSDPTVDSFTIKTKISGDFSKILQLISFQSEKISEEDVLFFNEINSILNLNSLSINFNSESELKVSNIITKILECESNNFFSKELDKCIDFYSSHLFEMNPQETKEIKHLKMTTIEKILNNSKIQLQTEDQLLNIINELYQEDSKYSYLYDYVYFINCSNEMIEEFVNIFDKEYMTNETWHKITDRLSNHQANHQNNRYKSNGIKIEYNNNDEFNGIINYFIKQKDSNIKDKINISASSIANGSTNNLIDYENKRNFLYTSDTLNSWICIEFKTNQIIPKHYTIRPFKDTSHKMKSWVIECSNNNNDWEIIDTQTNCSFLKGEEPHTFTIQNQSNKSFKYFRLRQTGPAWDESTYLVFNAIEIYGIIE